MVRAGRERKARMALALAAFKALSTDERSELLAELFPEVEAEGDTPTASSTPTRPEGSFADRAEALVLRSPHGLTTKEVADGIGQAVASCDGTLRLLVKRGTIERRDNKWWPLTLKVVTTPQRKTLRDLISEVITAAGKPIGASDIFHGVLALKPDAKRPSIDAELVRMRKDNLLVQQGVGANNGGLFVLRGGAPQT